MKPKHSYNNINISAIRRMHSDISVVIENVIFQKYRDEVNPV